MLRKTLTGGFTAAVIASAMSLAALPTPASAASLQFFFGPTESHSMLFNGRYAVKVCHTKYRWVIRHHHKRVAVAVGTECHWEYLPAKPMFMFNFGNDGDRDHRRWDH